MNNTPTSQGAHEWTPSRLFIAVSLHVVGVTEEANL